MQYQLLCFLRMLKEKGKKLFLLTNSPYYFVDGGMRFMLEVILILCIYLSCWPAFGILNWEGQMLFLHCISIRINWTVWNREICDNVNMFFPLLKYFLFLFLYFVLLSLPVYEYWLLFVYVWVCVCFFWVYLSIFQSLYLLTSVLGFFGSQRHLEGSFWCCDC